MELIENKFKSPRKEKFFECYCISLTHRRDRQVAAGEEFSKQGIKPYWWIVPKHSVPTIGVFQSQVGIIQHIRHRKLDSVIVFEDDVKFLTENFKQNVNDCVKELPEDWEILYMGANTHKPLEQFSEHLFVADHVFALHAVMYNVKNLQKYECLKYRQEISEPIDVMIYKEIQCNKKCFVAYPLLATQSNGFSDIENMEANQTYIEQRYAVNVSARHKKD